MSEIIKKKKALFLYALRIAYKAKEYLEQIHDHQEFHKTLTDKQEEAIIEYKEAFRKLLYVYQELESGRSK